LVQYHEILLEFEPPFQPLGYQNIARQTKEVYNNAECIIILFSRIISITLFVL